MGELEEVDTDRTVRQKELSVMSAMGERAMMGRGIAFQSSFIGDLQEDSRFFVFHQV